MSILRRVGALRRVEVRDLPAVRAPRPYHGLRDAKAPLTSSAVGVDLAQIVGDDAGARGEDIDVQRVDVHLDALQSLKVRRVLQAEVVEGQPAFTAIERAEIGVGQKEAEDHGRLSLA